MYPKGGIRSFIFIFVLLVGLPVALFLVERQTHLFSRALGVEADLVIDAGASYATGGDSWRNLAQGGEEKENMLSSVSTKVAALGINYIRLDHIYDFYNVVKRNPDNTLSFDWSKLDQVMGIVNSAGAKPFISLSYMPSAISTGSEVDLPKDWFEWELTVQKTIEHISGINELALSEVYYEVWNEPDLFGNFKTYGDKNYLDLYNHAALGAQKARDILPFKFGGPAITSFYPAWFDALLSFASKNNLRLDFFSWHRYTKNLDDFQNDLLEIKTRLRNYPRFANIEFLITESGHDSQNDDGYDNRFSAIHTIAAVTTLKEDIDKLFTFEIKDGPGPRQFWGRWGILTHERFGEPLEKDRYKALQFLNRLKGNRLNLAGEGSWIKAMSREENGVIRLLVVNYDASGKHIEAVPLNFINLPYQKFSFKRIDFLGTEREIFVATTSASWTTRELLNPNSAAIFEISPQ